MQNPDSCLHLDSLSRPELQALIKTHGLKGANKKTSELLSILEEFFSNPLTPSPSVNEFSDLESNLEEKEVKEKLLQILSVDTVSVLENQKLLNWNLLSAVEFKDFRDLGLNMATFLKLRNILLDKFPEEKQVMVPISEIESIVSCLLNSFKLSVDSKSSKDMGKKEITKDISKKEITKEITKAMGKKDIITKDIINKDTSNKDTSNKDMGNKDTIKKFEKGKGKYDNIKSKVALQWNK